MDEYNDKWTDHRYLVYLVYIAHIEVHDEMAFQRLERFYVTERQSS